MKKVFVICVTSILFAGAFSVSAQEQNQDDDVDPALLRRLWLGESGPLPAAGPYQLSASERKRFGGTFGIDLSHWSFDLSSDKKCKTPSGYKDPKCSCTINWDTLTKNGLRFAYSKASDATEVDLSFDKFWSDLRPLHDKKTLFRGAYHFLRPALDVDPMKSAAEQAKTFLGAIGAVPGVKPPAQLPPVLDIEWSNRRVTPGSSQFANCKRRTVRRVNDQELHYCDMWSFMMPAAIAAMAKQWIDIVEEATGRPVIVYTNPTGWWNSAMTSKEDALISSRAIWTSRYTSSGPEYNEAWTKQGGSPKWKMAPLPRGASYPQDAYRVPHFWQFTEAGSLPVNIHICDGRSVSRRVDLNWLPVSESDFPSLFGVGAN